MDAEAIVRRFIQAEGVDAAVAAFRQVLARHFPAHDPDVWASRLAEKFGGR